MNSFQFLTIPFVRQTFRIRKLFFLLKNKGRQISALAKNSDLSKAVTSSVRNPVEGSRYQVGDCLFEHLPNGESRCLKIFGVQSGGFSNVYTVIDVNGMMPYCLKENRALPGDEIVKNKDLRLEAEISLNLGYHPHLVTTHSVFYYRNRFHLLTEYVSGTSLDLRLKETPLDLQTALEYALHLCSAMLHTKKVFPAFRHGDIKPGNCLITDDNQLKLSDFGQSVISHADEMKGKLPGGTYYYMSPEMFDAANSNRDFSDIYAFGVTLFEMLSGVRPFSGSSRKEIVENHKHKLPPLDILRENGVPESVLKLISACLEKIPTDRPKDFGEIERELNKIYQAEFKQNAPKTEIFEPSVEQLIEQAVSFSVLGHYEKALSCVDKALQQDKFSAAALAHKALILSQLNSDEKILQYNSKSLSLKENSLTILFIHAKILFKFQHLHTALRYLEKALKIEPNNISALILKGEILCQKRRIYPAIKCFEKALVFDKFQAEASEKLAEIYFSEGFIEKALRIAEKGLERDLRNVRLLKISGDIYLLQEEKLKAIEFYKKVLSYSADEEKTSKLFINTCGESFKLPDEETKAEFLQIVTMASLLFYESKDIELSANFIEKLIHFLDESHLHPFILWLVDDAVISASKVIPTNLREDLCQCLDNISTVKIEKNLAGKFLYSIGKIYYQLGKIEKCETVFKQSLSLFGDDEKSYYYLAACREIEGDFRASLTFYNKALELNGLCELNRTGAKRVSAKLSKDDKIIVQNDKKDEPPLKLMKKNVFGYFSLLKHQYLLAVVYLSLILFIGFSSFKLGLSHYFVMLADKLKSDQYALKAIDADNLNPEAYNTRGLLFLRDKDYAKSLENFEKTSEFRPNDYYLWINIGYTRYKMNDFTGAEAAYQKSLELAPNYAQPHRYLGRFLLKNNQTERAFVHLGKAAESDFEIYPELLHLARKRFPDNPAEIEKNIQSNDPQSKKILANYLIKHHFTTESLRTFLTGGELNDNEKEGFIKYLMKKEEFQTAYEVWASLGKNQGKFENQNNNLIFDGGFEHLVENEETGFGWQIIPRNDTLAVFLDDNIHNSGNQAVKIKFDGQSRPKTSVISQLIIVKPNQNYRLTFAVKSSGLTTGGLPLIFITDAESNRNIAQSKVINSTNDKWIQQIVDFRTNETSLIKVNLQRMNCDEKLCPIIGELWLDDFSLSELRK